MLNRFGTNTMGDPELDIKKRAWDPKLNLTIPEVDLQAFPIATPLKDSEMDWVSRRWTVCQILREIYHAVDDPVLKFKCRVASQMTKQMIYAICKKEPHWGKFRWPWREKQSA